MRQRAWLQIGKPIPSRNRSLFVVFSFLLPILLWSAVSYVPGIWHPQILVTKPGSVTFLEPGSRRVEAWCSGCVFEAGSKR